MYRVECNQQAFIGLTSVEGTITKQQCLQQLQNGVIQGAGHVDTTFFQQDGAHPHTANVVLNVLPCPVEPISRALRVWKVLATTITGHE
jgi:hypothetical protein